MRELDDRLLTPGEVASLFRVDPKTVTRWAKSKRADGSPRLASVLTPGGHRRFWKSHVKALLNGEEPPGTPAAVAKAS